MNGKGLHMASFILLIVGGINWGLYGLTNLDLVEMLLGSYAPLDQIVYILIGVSAIYELITHKAKCKDCSTSI